MQRRCNKKEGNETNKEHDENSHFTCLAIFLFDRDTLCTPWTTSRTTGQCVSRPRRDGTRHKFFVSRWNGLRRRSNNIEWERFHDKCQRIVRSVPLIRMRTEPRALRRVRNVRVSLKWLDRRPGGANYAQLTSVKCTYAVHSFGKVFIGIIRHRNFTRVYTMYKSFVIICTARACRSPWRLESLAFVPRVLLLEQSRSN